MKSLFLILFLSVMFISCKDDNNLREITDDEKIFEYIGLKDKANVIEAQEKVWNTYGRPYRPSVQVVDGYNLHSNVVGDISKASEVVE